MLRQQSAASCSAAKRCCSACGTTTRSSRSAASTRWSSGCGKKIENDPAEPRVDPHGLGRRLQGRRCLTSTSPRRYRVWYRSLYWRIALGFVAFLALMLAAQGALFLWTDRSHRRLDAGARSAAARGAGGVDISAALDADPALDLDDVRARSVRPRLPDIRRADARRPRRVQPPGRRARRHPSSAAPRWPRRSVRARRSSMPHAAAAGRRSARADPIARDTASAAGRRRARLGEFAPVIVDGEPVGAVAVLPGGPPICVVVRELGPTMGLVGGWRARSSASALIALVCSDPRAPAAAAAGRDRPLGGGDLTARAPGRRRRRGGGAWRERSTGWPTSSTAAPGARRVGQGAPPAARRRVARADDAAHRDARLHRNARRCRSSARRRDARSAISASSPTKRTASSGSSATCSISRGSRAAAGRCVASEVPVRALFERVAARHERELTERGVTLIADVAPAPKRCIGDAERLEQALQNLVANALRHTPDGGAIALRGRADRRQASRFDVARQRPGHPARTPAAHLRPLLQSGRGARRRPAAAGSDCRS